MRLYLKTIQLEDIMQETKELSAIFTTLLKNASK